jgi:integrase
LYSDCLGIHPSQSSPRGTLKRVATGLYRSTASDVYFAHVRIHGKLFRDSLETADRETANRRLRDFRQSKAKVDIRAGKITLAALCDQYVATLRHLSRSSRKAKDGILRRLKTEWPAGAEQSVAAVKPSHCDAWLARQARRVDRSQYNAYVQTLRGVLQFAVRDRIIPENPASHLKYLKRDRPVRLTPSWEEFLAIVDDVGSQSLNAEAQASADFVAFIGLAGLGQAEAGALRWRDIDFERGQITTFRHKTRTGFVIPIYPQVRPLVEALDARRSGQVDERVFRIKDAKKAISGACRRLGLPHYTHRSFRRLFITRAIEKGVDVKVIAEWQGHRDGGKLILDTYSHVNRAHSQRMAQLMVDQEPENVVRLAKGAA